jgi:hypothetical protein
LVSRFEPSRLVGLEGAGQELPRGGKPGRTSRLLHASEESANALRADAAEQMGAAQPPTVGRYEVAMFEV